MDAAANMQVELLHQQTGAGARPDVSPGRHRTHAQMRKTAVDFESFYLGQMLQPMFSGIEASEPFNGGSAAKIWKSMMVSEIGKEMAAQGGVGIADMVMRELIEMQEAQ
ncbi:MAG: rod-binding protein [Rhodospirillales bacterium]